MLSPEGEASNGTAEHGVGDHVPPTPGVMHGDGNGKEARKPFGEASGPSQGGHVKQTGDTKNGITYRAHMRPALRLVTGGKCMDRASPTRRPTVARSIHLRLVS